MCFWRNCYIHDLILKVAQFVLVVLSASIVISHSLLNRIEEKNIKESSMDSDNLNNYKTTSQPQKCSPSLLKQIYGLLMKKAIYTMRKKRILAGQFLMPPIMIIFGILIFNTFYVPRENYPTRDISLQQYKDPIVVYHTDDDVSLHEVNFMTNFLWK